MITNHWQVAFRNVSFFSNLRLNRDLSQIWTISESQQFNCNENFQFNFNQQQDNTSNIMANSVHSVSAPLPNPQTILSMFVDTTNLISFMTHQLTVSKRSKSKAVLPEPRLCIQKLNGNLPKPLKWICSQLILAGTILVLPLEDPFCSGTISNQMGFVLLRWDPAPLFTESIFSFTCITCNIELKTR